MDHLSNNLGSLPSSLVVTSQSSSASDAPRRVHLLPAGAIKGADGRGPWQVRNAAALIAASMDSGRPLAIDYDHATDLAAPQGRPAPAAGWITGLEAHPDGIWGMVDWTQDGAKAVGSKAYRYLSPVFIFDKASGVISKLLRAALTNAPNLTLAALNSQVFAATDPIDPKALARAIQDHMAAEALIGRFVSPAAAASELLRAEDRKAPLLKNNGSIDPEALARAARRHMVAEEAMGRPVSIVDAVQAVLQAAGLSD